MIVASREPEIKSDQQPKRPVKKRYPAPPCPKCDSDNTYVASSPTGFQKCRCDNCGNFWTKTR